MIEALDIRVRGIVQGVGFRPFVYRLAKRLLITGWVLNDRDGVLIHGEGEAAHLDEFVLEIAQNPPAAAQVSEVELKEVPLQDCTGFQIRESLDQDTDDVTKVSPDLGICPQCKAELFDPANRRFRYPFINCTDCGPRFTIIDSLPYDRPATSMAPFTMCDLCAAEYVDPANRRFHAQPDACFTCGPELIWTPVEDGVAKRAATVRAQDRQSSDGILSQATALLAEGGILAVKGLGGFHLACDAANEEAVSRLRAAKRRDGKPFALMVQDCASARGLCEVSAAEEKLLESPARPIVLLERRASSPVAPSVVGDLKELGIMLPATPLQCLLLHDFQEATGRDALVMTSGNVHGEPIVTDDDEALEKLAGLADGILGNDRPILSRFDDSVLRVLKVPQNEIVQFVRRARGYAPQALALGCNNGEPQPEEADERQQVQRQDWPSVLAVGSEQKNTFTLTRHGEAFVSQYIGDLEDADVFDAWLQSLRRMERLFALEPRVLACDLHPEYIASKWARSQAFAESLPLTEVQHHHSHIASVLGEHGLFGPCCGIAFDGTGFGPDGALWGGEVLLANQVDYERFANLTYMPMPGGAAAIKHPQRMAYGALWTYDLLEHPAAQPLLQSLGDQADVCASMIESGLNTPFTSSLGRLFDAVAALLGIGVDPTYEGEPAILLDACRASQDLSPEAAQDARERYGFQLQKNAATATSTAHDTSVVLLDAGPVLAAVLDDLQSGVSAPVISLRFHEAVVQVVVAVAELVRSAYDISLVALSGGCFLNRFLVEQCTDRLGGLGFTVALNSDLPPNDGCISYGQAVVASVSR